MKKLNVMISSLIILFGTVGMAASLGDSREETSASISSERVQIYSVRLIIPYGNSTWNHEFAVPTGSNPLHITYTKETSCPVSPYIGVDVKPVSTGQWERTTVKGGLDYYSGGPISAIRFSINEPSYHHNVCSFRIAAEQGATTVNPSTEMFVGVTRYQGGFGNLELALTAPTDVTQFRIDIPAFCKDLQILEAYTVTEGIQDKATLVNPTTHLYSVNKGAGMRITKIQYVANGPVGQVCDVPIFMTIKK